MTRLVRRLITAIPGLLLSAVFASEPQTSHANDVLLPEKPAATGRAVCRLAKSSGLTPVGIAQILDAPIENLSVIHNFSGRFDAVMQDQTHRLIVSVHQPGGTSQQTRLRSDRIRRSGPAPELFLIQIDPQCEVDRARYVHFGPSGRPDFLYHFTGDPPRLEHAENLNPAVPPGTDPGGVAVAQIDAGINYTSPQFAARLARRPDGSIYGRDMSDRDGRPFDLDPSGSPLLPRRHGTGVASIILEEAPESRLIPIRHPGKNPAALAEIVAIIANGPARIVVMPLGSSDRETWVSFARAANANPDILFVISAGNNGRNLDEKPIYPASFDNDNFIVVTSVDFFGQLPPESNWGPRSVDIAVPGEMIEVIDHRGVQVRASGASYAAPRIAALAARLSAKHPDWGPVEIKAAILKYAILLPRRGDGKTRYGWLPNPAAVGPNSPK